MYFYVKKKWFYHTCIYLFFYRHWNKQYGHVESTKTIKI